ncbi:MAG: hypothetical protein AAF500_11710 [Myxococcota bacterium]
MRNLFTALAVTLFWLPASFADAADCLCDWSLSLESCIESADANLGPGTAEEPRRAPMWCERSDDPRCMPAGTHGGVFQTLLPLAHAWFQPNDWATPPRSTSQLAIRIDGGDRAAHPRRIDRPPR